MCKEVKEENEGQSVPLDKGPKAKNKPGMLEWENKCQHYDSV